MDDYTEDFFDRMIKIENEIKMELEVMEELIEQKELEELEDEIQIMSLEELEEIEKMLK
jgi:hypothetical protein